MLASVARLVEVDQTEYAFAPAQLTINAGDTVRWVNRGALPHNTTADSGAWASPLLMAPGVSFSHTFTAAGTFSYRCTLHAINGQAGTIVVQADRSGRVGQLPAALPGHRIGRPATIACRMVRDAVGGRGAGWRPRAPSSIRPAAPRESTSRLVRPLSSVTRADGPR